MAQDATTVTPNNPSPPSNFSFSSSSPPTACPNYTKNSYLNPFNMSAVNNPTGSLDGRPVQTTPGVGANQSPPPFYDDGTALTTISFAANKAALASGTGATSGGTESSYPGTGTYGSTSSTGTPNAVGAVPASTTAAHEGAGTEALVTQTYSAAVLVPGSAASYMPTGQTPAWADGAAGGPLRTTSDLGNYVGLSPTSAGVTTSTPNQQHASSLSPTTNPTLSSISPTTIAAAAGTMTLTATTVGATRQSVIWFAGVPYPTTFVSSTSLTAVVAKKTTAQTVQANVVTGGVVVTVDKPFVFS